MATESETQLAVSGPEQQGSTSQLENFTLTMLGKYNAYLEGCLIALNIPLELRSDFRQDLFLKVVGEGKIKPTMKGAPTGFNRTATHFATDYRRHLNSLERRYPSFEAMQEGGFDIQANLTPEEAAIRAEEQQLVWRSLLALSPLDGYLLFAYHIEERPIKELVEPTGKKEGALKMALIRARERFALAYANGGVLPKPGEDTPQEV